VMKDFALEYDNYFKKDYEEKAHKVITAYHAQVKGGSPFRGAAQGNPLFQNLKIGRTDFFSQKGRKELDGEPEVVLESADNKKAKVMIHEFLTKDLTNNYIYNNSFFTSAFALKKGDVSSALSETMKGKIGGRKVFFVIKKVDEQLPDMSKGLTVEQQNVITRTRQIWAQNTISALFFDYLIENEKIDIEIDERGILNYLGLPIPKESGADSANAKP